MITPIAITVSDLAVPGRMAKLVAFDGTLDETNVDIEASAIYELISSLPVGAALVLDLEKLKFLNSKSIGHLTVWFSQSAGKGLGFYITKPQQHVYEILDVVGLTQVIPFSKTTEEMMAQVAVS